MKKCCRVLQIIMSVLAGIIALLFIVIEGQKIVCGDWILHEQPLIGLMQYLLRFGIAAFVFISSLRHIHGKRCTVYESLCITVSCAVMAALVPNGFGVLFLILSALQLILDIQKNTIK